MEKQVSTLYPLDGSMDKRKTLAITKVMKGALSVSKSRTGEAIYRSNEFHKKCLERQIKEFKSAAKTEIDSYESKKRTITQRFSTMFGKHKATNETMQAYDTVITRTLQETANKYQTLTFNPITIIQTVYENDEGKEEHAEDEADGITLNGVKHTFMSDSTRRIQNLQKIIDDKEKKSVFVPTGILQPISHKFTRLKFHEEPVEEEPVVVEEIKEVWPLEDTEKYDTYIRTQKDRHEVLVTRNILKKIKRNITGNNTLLKFQMKHFLTDDPEEFVRSLTSAKTAPPTVSTNKDVNKQFKRFISKLPNQTTRRSVHVYAPLASARLFPPITSGSIKSTSRLLQLTRSKTMPV